MQVSNLTKWPLGLALILLAIHCQARRQRKRLPGLSSAKELRDYSSLRLLNDTSSEIQQSIVSWTGARILSSDKQKKMSSQSSQARRHKTKSGLLIESNVADVESTESVTKKKSPQRRRNGKLPKSGGGGGKWQ